jgi:hypothetical protein
MDRHWRKGGIAGLGKSDPDLVVIGMAVAVEIAFAMVVEIES